MREEKRTFLVVVESSQSFSRCSKAGTQIIIAEVFIKLDIFSRLGTFFSPYAEHFVIFQSSPLWDASQRKISTSSNKAAFSSEPGELVERNILIVLLETC